MIVTNEEYSNTEAFVEDCKRFNLKPTTRQASKYRLHKGALYKLSRGHEVHIPKQALLEEV